MGHRRAVRQILLAGLLLCGLLFVVAASGCYVRGYAGGPPYAPASGQRCHNACAVWGTRNVCDRRCSVWTNGYCMAWEQRCHPERTCLRYETRCQY